MSLSILLRSSSETPGRWTDDLLVQYLKLLLQAADMYAEGYLHIPLSHAQEGAASAVPNVRAT